VRLLSNSPEETVEAGSRLGRILKAGSTVCLFGSLGSGKTTFVKGIGRALGIPERDIMSASFTIVAEHDTDPPFYHIDLYRIKDDADLESTGVYDFIGGDGIAVVEWAEKLEPSEGSILVSINFLQDESREIIIEGIDEKDWNNMQA
jgi:tRNA threonylcarbamoyladenosine biosynthesis protein TsaE